MLEQSRGLLASFSKRHEFYLLIMIALIVVVLTATTADFFDVR